MNVVCVKKRASPILFWFLCLFVARLTHSPPSRQDKQSIYVSNDPAIALLRTGSIEVHCATRNIKRDLRRSGYIERVRVRAVRDDQCIFIYI